jgi:type IV pilus assembly protein PilP
VVVKKKIHNQLSNTENINSHSVSISRSKKPPLSSKSDVSIIKTNSERKALYSEVSKKENLNQALYNPKGKIDPFEPLLNDRPEIKKGSLVPVIDRVGKLTVLQKIELSQLRLTGIILATSGHKGLVQESTGKGHIVKVGTDIGARGGKVVSILKDRVIVEEKLKDFTGKIVVEQKEIKIIKHADKI